MKEKTHLGNRLLSVLLTFLMLLSLLPSAALAADTQQIALMAVTQNGFLIEPEYVTYHSGDTVKDVLKKSSHTFSGIDSGYITAVDGTTDNFSIHYDEDGYKLDQSADGLTAIWFTTNSDQSHGANLQKLAANMAVYNTATNGLKDYRAAQEAYDAAVKGFYAATDTTAKTLNDALFSAIDKHAKFLEGKTTPLTISATMGGEAITPGEAVFTSEFGTVVTVKNTNTVDLIPATYTFDLSDGEFRHVRGTLEVKEGTTLTAQLPAGQWIKSVGIGIDNYWKTYGEMPKQDVTAAEGTYLIPDHAYNSLSWKDDPREVHFLYANSYEREAAAQLFEKWLETHPMPQALFTTSFALLQGVMDVTLRRDGKLPSDLAIATFGDNELLDFLQCPVLAVAQRHRDVAERVLEIVLASLDEPRKPKPGLTRITRNLYRRGVLSRS